MITQFEKLKNVDWTTTLFLLLTPAALLVLAPWYLIKYDVPWTIWFATAAFYIATNMAITAGYHRMFSHRSYEGHTLLKIIYLAIGAGAFQGPALKWCSDHRVHHRFVDTEKDPYNINRGFWFAHILWLFDKTPPVPRTPFNTDLFADRLVMFQYKYYVPIAIVMGFGFPSLLGWLVADSWMAGFIFIGIMRLVASHHSTFFINSLCHMVGTRPYSDKISARDSMIMAFFTNGEGYHNYHHKFEADYRNGIRWYQWDPTKWMIYVSSKLGLAKRLNRVSPAQILRAQMNNEELRLRAKGVSTDRLVLVKARVEAAQQRFKQLKIELNAKKQKLSHASREQVRHLQLELRKAKLELKIALAEWQQLNFASAAC